MRLHRDREIRSILKKKSVFSKCFKWLTPYILLFKDYKVVVFFLSIIKQNKAKKQSLLVYKVVLKFVSGDYHLGLYSVILIYYVFLG